ncbi:MAG: Rrf2 family transcriptional regulator [Planctomycetaceae bacterium]|nr:Rrf2 family transcriptional regulator [Planctomycetaceae bacterium]
MISQTVEYALRAIVTIAQHEGQPCTAKKLAWITQVPLLYLSKLMQGLVRGSLVTSQRGLHGGLLRTRSPSELTILDVFNVVEPIKRITQCPLRIQSHGTNLCPLHRRLDAAIAATEKIFQETTLAEMQSQPGSVTPLCEEKKLFSLGVGATSSAKTKSRTKTAARGFKKKE